MNSTPAADALAAARENLKVLEAAANTESFEQARREADERVSALGAKVKAFQEETYQEVVGGISEYIGFNRLHNGIQMDLVKYTNVESSCVISTREGFELYGVLEDLLGI